MEIEKIWVRTGDITKATKESYDIWKNIGKSPEGDWDLDTVYFKDLDIYESMSMRFEKNYQWDQTPLYDRALEQIKDGKKKWGCTSEEELQNRFTEIDSLYKRIKEEGYKSQEEMIKNNDDFSLHSSYPKQMQLVDEITINISRNDEFLFNDGRHRLSIAKILGIEKIPVVVILTHPKSSVSNKQK